MAEIHQDATGADRQDVRGHVEAGWTQPRRQHRAGTSSSAGCRDGGSLTRGRSDERGHDAHRGVQQAEIAVLPEGLHGEAVALWQQVGLTRPWNDPGADLERAVRGPASTVLAAVDRGALLGTAMAGHDGHRGWVYYLAVAPDEQRRGLGRRLVQACEEWVRARGVPKLQLMVRQDNEVAAAFYRRLGYETAEVVVLGRRLDGGPAPGDGQAAQPVS